jgi:hypothetical protein
LHSKNCDDTIAHHALHDKTAVLSGDRDFYRYTQGVTKRPVSFELYSDFRLANGGLDLMNQTPPREPRLPLIDLLVKRPRVASDCYAYDLQDLKTTKCMWEGYPSPLIRRFGRNPFGTITPLRKLGYQLVFGEDGMVDIKEEIPTWDPIRNKAEHQTQYVTTRGQIDATMLALARDPRKAFEHFFPAEARNQKPDDVEQVQWTRHVHVCKQVVIHAVLFVAVQVGEDRRSFVQACIEAERW